MSLPIPNLDDRRFQDIVDEAKRLIPQYCPEWTNLEATDPGVALIELFAWMSEMIMFRLNQVPDAFYTRMLNLMGVQPFPPAAARAELTFWLRPDHNEPVRIAAGTEVATAGDEPIVFVTECDLQLDQPTLHSLLTRQREEDGHFHDEWDELHRDGVTCFPTLTAGECLYLGFAGSLASHAIRLDVEITLMGLGIDPADPPLTWEVPGNDGWWIPTSVVQDSTGGLCRSGAITLLVPSIHAPSTEGGSIRAYWLRARLLHARPDQHAYRTSPVLRGLSACTVGGTVAAEHSQTMLGELLGISDGRADQRFTTRIAPILARREGECIVTYESGSEKQWQEVDDFMHSGPFDSHVVWDGASGEIRFGKAIRSPDGSVRRYGATPPRGAEITVSAYRHGGGAAGNVGAGTLRVMRTPIAGVDRVENLRSAFGGVDGETIENAKTRGPLVLRSGSQAVTGADYERVVFEADASIARVRCLPPVVAGAPIRILVVPRVEPGAGLIRLDDMALSAGLMERIAAHLEPRRVLGVEVEIGTPFYQGVSIAALLTARPGRPAGLVRERALEALYRFLDPVIGGRSGEGWPFGVEVTAAAVFQLLDGIEGVERVDDVVFFEYDLRQFQRVGFARSRIRLDGDSLFLPTSHQVVVR